MSKKGLGNERAGIKADGAAGYEITPAHRDKIGGARSCAYEMNSHEPSPIAIAQVTFLAATRAPSNRALWPAATRADASAIDGTPLIA